MSEYNFATSHTSSSSSTDSSFSLISIFSPLITTMASWLFAKSRIFFSTPQHTKRFFFPPFLNNSSSSSFRSPTFFCFSRHESTKADAQLELEHDVTEDHANQVSAFYQPNPSLNYTSITTFKSMDQLFNFILREILSSLTIHHFLTSPSVFISKSLSQSSINLPCFKR